MMDDMQSFMNEENQKDRKLAEMPYIGQNESGDTFSIAVESQANYGLNISSFALEEIEKVQKSSNETGKEEKKKGGGYDAKFVNNSQNTEHSWLTLIDLEGNRKFQNSNNSENYEDLISVVPSGEFTNSSTSGRSRFSRRFEEGNV